MEDSREGLEPGDDVILAGLEGKITSKAALGLWVVELGSDKIKVVVSEEDLKLQNPR